MVGGGRGGGAAILCRASVNLGTLIYIYILCSQIHDDSARGGILGCEFL